MDGPPGTAGFEAVLAPLARAAAERIPAGPAAGAVDLAAVRAEFVRRLGATLARRSARTLVLELDAARRRGDLNGDTPSERFHSFAAMTGCQSGLAALFAAYPVLARLLGQTCLHAAEALAELLDRFEADRPDVVATLLGGADPGALVGVASGAGDGHRRGRSVAVLRFADGRRVVYKPRPLRAHRHFNDVVGWFNARPGTPGLPVAALLDRGGYGWVEHIAHLPSASEQDLERFYRRQGALLALLYALDGTDFHHENLIARGDEPFLIDVETLFHPPPTGPGVDDPAAAALQASVYRTGLLPHLLLGDRAAVDASGLGGDAGAPLPADAVTWADPGTDRMRLVRGPQVLTGAANRPSLAGVAAEPAAYLDALLDGFRAGYRAVASGRTELLGSQGWLARFAGAEVRVVVRPTQTYATLLAESTHPDVLRDAAQRDALFGLLGTNRAAGPGHPGVLGHEIAQLWDGDVPLFTTRPDSLDLWSGDAGRIHGALDRTGLDRVAERLRSMDESDLEAQQWVIRASMAARSTAAAHAPAARRWASSGPGEPDPGREPDTDPEQWLDAACRIGDLLLASGHRGSRRTNWLGLELIADRYWQLRPCGADLGGGYTGVALFLAQLAALTGQDRHAEAAVRALAPLPSVLERLAASPQDLAAVGPGGYAGLGGIAYAVTAAAAALDDPGLASLRDRAVDLTVLAAESEPAAGPTEGPAERPAGGLTEGLAEGLAGGLAALLAVHQATGSAGAWRGARACAARLAARPLPPEPGFASGAAGVGWALLGFAEAAGDADCERAGLAALRAAAVGTAADRRAEGAWCRGLVGVALAVADRPVASGDAQLAELVERTLRGLDARPGPLPDHSLCHGEPGVLELLGRSAALVAPVAPGAQAARRRRARRWVAVLERHGPVCGTPAALAVPGLLTGLAGVGHGLLRLGFPERTPSVLLLQAPTP
ncbi:type 2 lanthipeptide synthetase LanM family protein [Streptacidiphilus melanogenes]|uniref:type 2 lanthipeptide synthetase LanM family protein n=1 Tax=Streptacidiphilus melanogenes TaxID=411235 RepID=UPI00126A36FB|nr:type 2 lanthipeptide synthetase LanM family protein [Streptacidiphilus melanogenes]